MTPEDRADAIAWLRERPAILYPLIRRFPPGCEVKAKVPLVCPGPGKTGHVVSYYESGATVGVLGEDTFMGAGQVKADCSVDDLEVVGYMKCTPDDIADMLAEIEKGSPSGSDE